MKIKFWFDKDNGIELSDVPKEEILRFKRLVNSNQMVLLNNRMMVNLQNVKYIEFLEE